MAVALSLPGFATGATRHVHEPARTYNELELRGTHGFHLNLSVTPDAVIVSAIRFRGEGLAAVDYLSREPRLAVGDTHPRLRRLEDRRARPSPRPPARRIDEGRSARTWLHRGPDAGRKRGLRRIVPLPWRTRLHPGRRDPGARIGDQEGSPEEVRLPRSPAPPSPGSGRPPQGNEGEGRIQAGRLQSGLHHLGAG